MYEDSKHTMSRMQRVRGGAPLDLLRVMLTARSQLLPRWKGFVLSAIALGGLAIWFAPQQFSSKAVLVWEGTGGELREPGRELHTLVDSVKTPANLAEVQRQKAIEGTGDSLGSRIEVSFAERSNLITIAAVGKDPKSAHELANGILKVFLDQRLKLDRSRKERLVGELTAAVDSGEKDLADRRAAWDAFCRSNNVSDLPSVMQLALGEGAHLSAQRVAAHADAEAEGGRAESLLAAASRQSESVVISQKMVSPTGSKLAEVERELAGLRDSLSADHPQILALKAQATALRAHPQKASAEVTTERNMGRNPQWDVLQENFIEAKAREDAAHRREAALTQLAGESTARIGKLSEIEGNGSRLSLAMHSAETHLTDVQSRRAQAQDEARSPRTGLLVLSAPELPAQPSKSSRKQLAFVALLLGLFGPLGFLTFHVLRGLRVHSATEVAYWGRGPVLASMPCFSSQTVDDLRRDLAGPARRSGGTTLLLPFGEGENGLVQDVARALGCPVSSTLEELDDLGRPPLVAFIGEFRAGRRALRLADRAVIVIRSGEHSAIELAFAEPGCAEARALGYLVLGGDGSLERQAGAVEQFWSSVDERRGRADELAARRAK